MGLSKVYWIVLGLAFCGALDAVADTRSQGEIGLSSRAFSDDNDASTEDLGASVEYQLDFRARQSGGFRQQLRFSGRNALREKTRTVVILNDAWVGWRGEHLELVIGAETLNWSSAEVFNPTDGINSRNLDSDLERPEKMAEPILRTRLRFGEGGLDLMYLPARIEPRFPGAASRLNWAGSALGQAYWGDQNGHVSRKRFAHQLAVRADQTFGSTDLTLHYVSHADRAMPGIAVNQMTGEAVPIYSHTQRIGGSVVSQVGDWLVKFESEYRSPQATETPMGYQRVLDGPESHYALVLGADYGWTYESDGEGTLLLEAQTIQKANGSTKGIGLVGPFQRDCLVAYRHAFNDVDGTELLFGWLFDLEMLGEGIATVSGSQRLSNTWKLEGKLQYVNAPDTDSLLNAQHENAAVYVDLVRSF